MLPGRHSLASRAPCISPRLSPSKHHKMQQPDSPKHPSHHHHYDSSFLRACSFTSDPGQYSGSVRRANNGGGGALEAYMRNGCSNSPHSPTTGTKEGSTAMDSPLLSWLVNSADFPSTNTWEYFNRTSVQRSSEGSYLASFSLNLLDSSDTHDVAARDSDLSNGRDSASSSSTRSYGIIVGDVATYGSISEMELPALAGSWDALPAACVNPEQIAAALACCPTHVTKPDTLARFSLPTLDLSPWGALPPAGVDMRDLAHVHAVCPAVLPPVQSAVVSAPEPFFDLAPLCLSWATLPPACVDTQLLCSSLAVCPNLHSSWSSLPAACVDAELLRSALAVCPNLPQLQQPAAAERSAATHELSWPLHSPTCFSLPEVAFPTASVQQQKGSWDMLPLVSVCKELLMSSLPVCPPLLTGDGLLPTSGWAKLPDACVDRHLLAANLAVCPPSWTTSAWSASA